MIESAEGNALVVQPEWVGDGEMAQRIEAFDWSRTSIGGPETWSSALRTTLQIILASRFPHLLWWGPDYIQFYNDAYRPIVGSKHPHRALGCPVHECWSEIWHILRPLIDRPFSGGPATWSDDILLEINRHGFFEESHFTIAYSPVPDEAAAGGIGGVLATVHEITEKVIGERRVVALRDLAASMAHAKTAEDACDLAAKKLASNDKDIPFALVYLVDQDGRNVRLAGTGGVEAGRDMSPETVSLAAADQTWPFREARDSGVMQVVEHLHRRFSELPPGPWSDHPRAAVVVPLPSSKPHQPVGFLIAGVSARLKLDVFYGDFFDLARTQIATAIANARAYEMERNRAEALAEIDRAKTAFFSNVSHEFRTPLTLMLGPIEDLLACSQGELSAAAREQLDLVNRNSRRLLRLVNTLLDFSRIEAGRVRACYEPTDLGTFTAELASLFRAATERAGLRLAVDCPPQPEPVYVDREMWEKIVLNLLSNAFKFTLQGEIDVSIRRREEAATSSSKDVSRGWVELSVRDTGVGIPAEEIARVFERFHRVEATRGRTHEGSGIGLALVQELVKLHAGVVEVQSTPGIGTTFTVRVPTGTTHLPPEKITEGRSLALSSDTTPFVEEALRWLPDESVQDKANESWSELPGTSNLHSLASTALNDSKTPPRSFVLVVDDNADMRLYVQRLLAPHYDVELAPHGNAALRAARLRVPDLVLSDIMMPELDGFDLLREIRRDPELRNTPVILLSARAGEESRVEGLAEGADDYLVKPFSARELLARVESHVRLSRLRKQHEAELRVYTEKLEQTVVERTQRLRATIHELEAFSYSIAHDMRAPLRAMQGFANILEHEHGMLLPPDGRNYLQRMSAAAARLDDLIQDVLNYSKIARAEMNLTAVEPKELIREIVDSYPNLQMRAGQISIADLLPPVLANRAALTQVIANLLGNAVKFVSKDVCAQVKVWGENLPDDGIRIWFEDNGIGIRPEAQERIFLMFQRLNTPSQYEGTGIGLSIVKKAMERMGGTVGVQSQPGAGSKFWIQLKTPNSNLS